MIISVTNRRLCSGNFEERISDIAKSGIFGVILREKDMNEDDYTKLLISLKRHFSGKTKLIANSFTQSAKSAGVKNIHLPYSIFEKQYNSLSYFELKGVSVHSRSEAVFAEKNGADYITAGHIFETQCKKGLAPRGLEYLRDIKAAVKIPVFAIGGINEQNCIDVKDIADGICVMSNFMTCDNAADTIKKYKYALQKSHSEL